MGSKHKSDKKNNDNCLQYYQNSPSVEKVSSWWTNFQSQKLCTKLHLTRGKRQTFLYIIFLTALQDMGKIRGECPCLCFLWYFISFTMGCGERRKEHCCTVKTGNAITLEGTFFAVCTQTSQLPFFFFGCKEEN